MSFKALDEVFDSRLALPAGANGKIYYVPEGSFEVGAWCLRLFMAAQANQEGTEGPQGPPPKLQFDGPEEEAVQARLLGPELMAELKSDGLGARTVGFIVETVVFWHACGKEVAEMYWNAGGRPEDFLPAANRAARRRAAASTNTGAASTTPRRGSTSGTTPRKAKSTG